MNRRDFFATLAGLTAVDPDRLVWTPGKLISLPTYPKHRTKPHTFQFTTPDWIASEMLRLMRLRFCYAAELEKERHREAGLDLKFMAGDQWMIRQSRTIRQS